ncbi:MAG: alpha-amylase family glycosyl hydrolase [Bacteroidota bacterium]
MQRYSAFIICLLILFSSTGLEAQTETQILEGHFHRNDTSYFFFSEKIYQVNTPQKVVITGSFRGWSQDMEEEEWQLVSQGNSLWTLQLYNPKFTRIPPRAEFKFRIDDGTWLQPPSAATNSKGGNLVFLQDIQPAMLKAELKSSGNIWVEVQSLERPIDPQAYILTNAEGTEIPIADVLPNQSQDALLIPAEEIDIRRVYYLQLKGTDLKSWCSFDGWFRELYSNKELGANINEAGTETVFRVFSPRSSEVKLYLYKGKDDEKAYETIEMQRDKDGVWESFLKGNLAGVWYDFTVHGPKDPGNHFYETEPTHISDPYCRVSDDTWGKCMVAPKTIPATPLKAGIPPMESVISYEVHVQDFTDLLPVDENIKSTLPAFYKSGLKNSRGKKIGFDYLVDLGINTVHLMPVQEFLHYKEEDWKPAFKDDPFMIEQGISEENYQWGYRTSHCFAVESRYRQRDTEPGAEREQFRDLVQAFHDKGIAVIIDIVPNHTAENMDKDPYYFHFSVLDKVYYYRTKDLELIGEYGNEVKTENRPMVQRWLIDQCKHWIEEFGIDGFRVDLAGQIDRQSLQKLREALGPDIIIYGEPWIASYDPDFENNPSWDWYKHNSPITFFQDDARNAFKGPVSNPEEKERDQGYAGGNFREFEKVKLGLANKFADDKTPLSGINYLDIHDNWALADQFANDNWDGRMGVDEDRYKIAALLLYTSLGPIVTHGGTEMIRSKGHAALREDVKEMVNGTKVYLHGKRDTYNMRTANQFVWENLGKSKKDKDCHCDYENMYQFWRGLNHFRLSEIGEVFRVKDSVADNYYEWIDTVNPYQLGYIVDRKIFVLINTGSDEHEWEEVDVPAGNWKLIGNNTAFDHVKGVKDDKSLRNLEGGKKHSFRLAGKNFKVWIKND